MVDHEGRVIAVNQQFAQMWRLTPEELTTCDDNMLLQLAARLAADPERFVADVRAAYAERPDARHDLVRLADGRHFDRMGRPLRNSDGSDIGWAWYFRDVTSYVDAEAQLQRLADTLQFNLLPPLPPTIPGLELSTRYVPATVGVAVGGDFYDAFRLRSNAWGLVVGDVCGKGPEAAALTSLVRYSVRAIAQHAEDPTEVLLSVNSTLLSDASLGERFAAVVYARVEQDVCGAWLTIACGGHPLPLAVRRAGWVDLRGQAGTALGLFDVVEIANDRVGLGPGDAMVFCTDGITEAHQARGELFAEEALPDTLLRCAADGCEAEAIADHLIEAARTHAGGTFDDDVALMVVRVPPDADADERLRSAFGGDIDDAQLPDYPVGEPSWGRRKRPLPPREARLRLERHPTAVPSARAFVEGVLHSWRMSELADAGDTSLLTSEMVTNAVLHGTDPFTVIVRYDGSRVRIEVGDGSRAVPRRRDLSDEATTGRGLHLVEALATTWGTQPTLNGKRVWFEVPAPPYDDSHGEGLQRHPTDG